MEKEERELLALIDEIRQLWDETDGDVSLIKDERLLALINAAEASLSIPRLVEELLAVRDDVSPERRASINNALQPLWALEHFEIPEGA